MLQTGGTQREGGFTAKRVDLARKIETGCCRIYKGALQGLRCRTS